MLHQRSPAGRQAPTEPPGPQDVLFGKADTAPGSLFRFMLLLVLTNFAKNRGESFWELNNTEQIASTIFAVLVTSWAYALLYSNMVKIAVVGACYWLFPARSALSLGDQESLADAQLSPLIRAFGSTPSVATEVWTLRGGPRG